jgi:argininosuccinate lyase
MKLWQKNTNLAAAVEKFTVGNDLAFDAMLAPFDVLGSLAHVRMLAQVGLLESSEAQLIDAALKNI